MASTRVGEIHAELGLDDKLQAKLSKAEANFKSTARSMDAEAALGLDSSGFDKGLTDAETKANRSGAKIGDELGDGLGGSSGKLSLAGGLAGGAIVAGLSSVVSAGVSTVVTEIDKAFARDSARASLGASLLLPPEMSRELGRQAGEVWAQGWGENEEEVGRAMRGLIVNVGGLGDLTEDEFEGMTIKALALADTMGIDVVAATRSVGGMIKNGMAADATEGFDIIARGLSGLDESMQDELLETLDEYGANFRELGLTGPQVIGMVTASVAAGGRNTDLAADSLREFHDIVKERSPESQQAFADLGLNADTAYSNILAGGPGAAQTLSDVVVGLQNTADPKLRDDIGQDLFGTKWFDNGANAILAMDPLKAGLNDVAGSADKVTGSLDTQGAQWEAVKRTMQEDVTDWLVGTAFPIMGDFNTKVTGMKDALGDFGTYGIDPIVGSLQTLFGWIGDTIEKFEDFTDAVDLNGGGGIVDFALGMSGFKPPGFDTGGIVPGPRGSAQLVMAHAGETILPTHKQPNMAAAASAIGAATTTPQLTSPIVVQVMVDKREIGRATVTSDRGLR